MTKKDREIFRRIASTMQVLMDPYFEQEEITKLVGDFNWDVITLTFRSENIKRQKNSLRYIIKLIKEAMRKENLEKEKIKRKGSFSRFWKKGKNDVATALSQLDAERVAQEKKTTLAACRALRSLNSED